MEEHRVEFVEIKKVYASVTVDASSRKEAITKVRQNLELYAFEVHESSSQTEWAVAEDKPSIFAWFTSLWK